MRGIKSLGVASWALFGGRVCCPSCLNHFYSSVYRNAVVILGSLNYQVYYSRRDDRRALVCGCVASYGPLDF